MTVSRQVGGTVAHAIHSGDDVLSRLLKATALLLGARVDTKDPPTAPFDALWRRRDAGFYAVSVIDCRAAPAERTAVWAADEARPHVLAASGWEERLRTDGDPELVLILLLGDLCHPGQVKLDFEAEIAKMPKPTRTHVWLTIEAFATTSLAESPGDLFVMRDF
jgi:hypothetical protein